MKRRVFLKSMAGMGLYLAANRDFSLAAAGKTSNSTCVGPTTSTAMVQKDYSWMVGALNGFSATLIQEHLALLKRYIEELNTLESRKNSIDLGGANPVFSHWRTCLFEHLELRNAIRLHDYYFSGLTSRNMSAGKRFGRVVVHNFGSFDQWWVKFRASALASRAWCMFGFDTQTGKCSIFGTDNDRQCPMDFVPVLVVDMAEHAYCLDYPGDPYAYLDAWLKRVNWQEIDKRLANISVNGS